MILVGPIENDMPKELPAQAGPQEAVDPIYQTYPPDNEAWISNPLQGPSVTCLGVQHTMV